MSLFDGAIINTPETLFEGRVCTQYHTLDRTLLCIEVKLDLGAGKFRDSIEQIITGLEGMVLNPKPDE